MKKTEHKIICGTKSGYPVYRTVFKDGERYVVKWNGEIVNVAEFKDGKSYIERWEKEEQRCR